MLSDLVIDGNGYNEEAGLLWRKNVLGLMKNIKISFKDREVVNYNQSIAGEKKKNKTKPSLQTIYILTWMQFSVVNTVD